jgi:hypothetical protein
MSDKLPFGLAFGSVSEAVPLQNGVGRRVKVRIAVSPLPFVRSSSILDLAIFCSWGNGTKRVVLEGTLLYAPINSRSVQPCGLLNTDVDIQTKGNPSLSMPWFARYLVTLAGQKEVMLTSRGVHVYNDYSTIHAFG